jgi:hypothetical protein
MSGLDWDLIPHTGGLLVNNKTGKVMHQQHLTINREAQKWAAGKDPHTDTSALFRNGKRRSAEPAGKRPPPPVINLRCYDVVGANPGLCLIRNSRTRRIDCLPLSTPFAYDPHP